MSATDTEVTTKPAKARSRTKTVHYYIVRQARIAEAVGLPTPYLCGRVAKGSTCPAFERELQTVGGLMALPEKRDCRQCVRIHEAHLLKAQRLSGA